VSEVLCEAAGCTRTPYARRFCERHYRQQLRGGAVVPDRAPAVCTVEPCGRKAVTRGWCHGHYLRWSRGGDVRADVPLARPQRDVCSVDDCERTEHSRGFCRSHYARWRVHGHPEAGGPLRTVTGDGSLSHGYWKVNVPESERHLHKNGDRLDNRLENLELWSTAQPGGQRVQDKVAFALWLLMRYEPALATVLHARLDPEKGLPEASAEAAGPDPRAGGDPRPAAEGGLASHD
jgi:hypothetical protein